MGGFGGSNKNIGIGCADGKIGKKMIHAGDSGSKWGVNNEEFMERMESRHSMRQLTYMKEMGMGNDRYQLVDIDNGDKIITAAEAVKGVKGTWVPDGN